MDAETRRLCALVIVLAVLMICVTVVVRAWVDRVPATGEPTCWEDFGETYCLSEDARRVA